MGKTADVLTSKPVLYGGAFVIGILVLRKLLRDVGLVKQPLSPQEKEQAKIVEQIKVDQNIWSPIAWKNFPKVALTEKDADAKAKIINNAWGVFDDDESAIKGVFRQINYRINVSQIAGSYQKIFREDLISVLEDRLSREELNEIAAIIALKK